MPTLALLWAVHWNVLCVGRGSEPLCPPLRNYLAHQQVDSRVEHQLLQVLRVAAQSHQQASEGHVHLAATCTGRGEGRTREATGARAGAAARTQLSLAGGALTQPPSASPASICKSCRTWRTRTSRAASPCGSDHTRLRHGREVEPSALAAGQAAHRSARQLASSCAAARSVAGGRAPASGAPSRLSVGARANENLSPISSGYRSVFTSRSRTMS